MLIDALSVLCAQLTRDLLAIAKFLFVAVMKKKLKRVHSECVSLVDRRT